jgi:hypothetical protein
MESRGIFSLQMIIGVIKVAEVRYMVDGDYIADFDGLSECLAFECEAEVVAVVNISNGVVVCLEKMYFWEQSHVSLTVIIENLTEGSKATIVGSGGGDGILNINYGNHYEFVTSAVNALGAHYGLRLK